MFNPPQRGVFKLGADESFLGNEQTKGAIQETALDEVKLQESTERA